MSEFIDRKLVEQWISNSCFPGTDRAKKAELYFGWYREKTVPIITQIVREGGY